MHRTFDDLVKQEKAKGKTIIMSSHIFSEVEECCDLVYLLREGHIIETVEMEKIHHSEIKTYRIQLADSASYEKFIKEELIFKDKDPTLLQVVIRVVNEDVNLLTKIIAQYSITLFSEIKYTLAEHFLNVYHQYDKQQEKPEPQHE
ncbi:ABC-type Na+ transport system, ATPase component [Bacteroidales bacterium Barb6]|nr:ABC-type Na+ transport system, ATPase component [Bacteroidales bacterium Barb6]